MSLSSLIKILLQPAMGWYIKKKKKIEEEKSFHVIHEGILAAVKILL